MEKFLDKCQPSDLVAIILIIGSLYLKISGTDGTTSMILIGICAYYFGKRFKIPPNINV
jgi:hypothetical protein